MPTEPDNLTLEQALDALKKSRDENADVRIKNRDLTQAQTDLTTRLDKIDADKKTADEGESVKRGEFEKLAKEAKDALASERRANTQSLAAAKRLIMEEAVNARLTDAVHPRVAELVDVSSILVGDDMKYDRAALDALVASFKTDNPTFIRAEGQVAPKTTNSQGLGRSSQSSSSANTDPVDWSKSDSSLDSLVSDFRGTLPR